MHKAELTLPRFRTMWSCHTPLVVRGIHLDFQVTWTPDYFIQRYGDQPCEVEDCQTGSAQTGYTVGKFFENFGRQHTCEDVILRLKDWPPKDDFNAVFPDLLDDFVKVVPMPDYCAPDGVFNLASHFPRNSIKPDLGPKIYNAYASAMDDKHKGSTRLHLDVADAVNIMTYAGMTSTGTSGFATWHIFRRDDRTAIRKYLTRRKRRSRKAGDPIHNQDTYLTPGMLQKLGEEYGVQPYVVQQYPGDAVFIPAGCPHQVSNEADCMKIACDFVSPESVGMCAEIAAELREQRLAIDGAPEEVLPVCSMLYYMWETIPLLESALLGQYAVFPELRQHIEQASHSPGGQTVTDRGREEIRYDASGDGVAESGAPLALEMGE
ncbi:hypothetical protein C8T65DRAFT_588767 [Cerioporus squamosus]|nr:hypothetical protein C8T65DRAFT_588767 [Cerioporus squamosus]